MRLWFLALLSIVTVFFLQSPAFADGKVFTRVAIPARIPDQSALITFDGKTERLVIETNVEGEGSHFAWVIPLPAVPKIEEATTGLFPTLRVITRPRVADYDSDWPLFPISAAVCSILIWIAMFRRQ